MKKSEFVAIVKENRTIAQGTRIAESLIKAIKSEIYRDGRSAIPGLGTLTIVERAACTRRNPRTGEAVSVPAKRTVKFRPSKEWKTALQG